MLNRWTSWSSLACVAALNGVVAGQGTLTFSHQKAEAGALYDTGAGFAGNTGIIQDFSGIDFMGVQNRPHASGGFNGTGYAEHGATFFPSNPGIGGPFSGAVLDACTSAEIRQSLIGPHPYEEAYGTANGVIEFSLNQAVQWSWVGGWQGMSHATGAYNEVLAVHELIDLGSGSHIVNEVRSSLNGVGDWVQNFVRGGTIGPGHYRLTWSHESYVLGGNTIFGFFPTGRGGGPLTSCINSTFRLTPAPAPLGLLMAGGMLAARRKRSAA